MDHNQSVSRRTFMQGSLAAGAGLAGSAWLGLGGAEAAEQPKRGGTLSVGGINDLNPKGVPYRLQASTTGQTVGTVFSTILRYNDTLDPSPHMAEVYELASDATSARIVLKKGIEFHSGRDFTTADVQWNLQKAAEKSQRSQVRQLAEAITEYKIDSQHE